MAFFDSLSNDQAGIVTMLNILRATEVVSAEQYYNHDVAFHGPNCLSVQAMLKEHAAEERKHADRLAERIDELDGVLVNSMVRIFELNRVVNPDAPDVQMASETTAMLRQDLVAEETAIEAYTEAVMKTRDADPVTALMLTEILGDEYHHRIDLKNLLS